jgi:hypothetical protein
MLEVDVTSEDITKGCPLSGSGCPVALAVKRIFPGARVAVSPERINIELNPGIWTSYVMPPVATAFVGYYDSGFQMHPIKFEVELVA